MSGGFWYLIFFFKGDFDFAWAVVACFAALKSCWAVPPPFQGADHAPRLGRAMGRQRCQPSSSVLEAFMNYFIIFFPVKHKRCHNSNYIYSTACVIACLIQINCRLAMIKELQHSSYSVVEMQLKLYQCSINNAKLSCCPATWWQF